MERDEDAAAVTLGELCACVEDDSVRRPVRGVADERLVHVCAAAFRHAVTAVFRREQLLARKAIVEAVRPTEIVAFLYAHELFGRQLRTGRRIEELTPVLIQVVTAVLRAVQ